MMSDTMRTVSFWKTLHCNSNIDKLVVCAVSTIESVSTSIMSVTSQAKRALAEKMQ